MASIGIDLDGVCFDFIGSYWRWIVEHEGFDPRLLTRPTSWDGHNYLGISLEDFLRHCQEGVDGRVIFCVGVPLPGSLEAVMMLKRQGHEIHFKTARNFGSRDQENTYWWLDKYYFPYDSVTFCSDKTEGPEVDIYLDDKPDTVDLVLAAGTEAYVLFDPPREDQLGHPRLLKDWKEFLTKVEELDAVREKAA